MPTGLRHVAVRGVLLRLAEAAGGGAFLALEELAEGRRIGKVEPVGHLPHDAREVDGRDAELRGIEAYVVVPREMGEKDHMAWEAQYLNYIDKLGYENFLIEMM